MESEDRKSEKEEDRKEPRAPEEVGGSGDGLTPSPWSVCEEQMAFCSYFKIQPVAGGADRIKKSEWKLVSHDNSQPPRERQLLPLRRCCFLPILHLPATFAVSLSLCFLHPRSEHSVFSVSFLSSRDSTLPVSLFLHPHPALAAILSIYQPLPSVSSLPTITIAINRFKYNIYIYEYM